MTRPRSSHKSVDKKLGVFGVPAQGSFCWTNGFKSQVHPWDLHFYLYSAVLFVQSLPARSASPLKPSFPNSRDILGPHSHLFLLLKHSTPLQPAPIIPPHYASGSNLQILGRVDDLVCSSPVPWDCFGLGQNVWLILYPPLQDRLHAMDSVDPGFEPQHCSVLPLSFIYRMGIDLLTSRAPHEDAFERVRDERG